MTQIDVRSVEQLPGTTVVATLAPEESYQRLPPTRLHAPTEAGQALTRHFSNLAGQVPAQQLRGIGPALVWGAGLVLKDGSLMKEHTEAAPLARILERLQASGAPRPTRVVNEPVLYTLRYGLNNYGHALTDIVPRMVAAWRARPDLRVAVVPGFVPTAIEALLDLGLPAERLLRLENDAVQLTQCFLADACSKHPLVHAPQSLALLRTASTTAGSATPERLFVTRDDAKTRHLRNHRAVAKALAARGFVEVSAGHLSHAEQVRLFRGAREVVGISGAALSNLLYCPPGTRITLLSPDTLPSLFFWDLASQLGLDFRIGYFAAHKPQDAGHADFQADPGVVMDLSGH